MSKGELRPPEMEQDKGSAEPDSLRRLHVTPLFIRGSPEAHAHVWVRHPPSELLHSQLHIAEALNRRQTEIRRSVP